MLPGIVKIIAGIAIPALVGLVGYKKVKKIKEDWDKDVKKRRKEIEEGKNPSKWL
jgi:hypothetical protein